MASYDEDEWEKDHAPRPKRRDAPRTETNRQPSRSSTSSGWQAFYALLAVLMAGGLLYAWLSLEDDSGSSSSASAPSWRSYLPSSEAEREDLRRLMPGALLCYQSTYIHKPAAYALTSSEQIATVEQFRRHLDATGNNVHALDTLRRQHAVARNDLVTNPQCAATAAQAELYGK